MHSEDSAQCGSRARQIMAVFQRKHISELVPDNLNRIFVCGLGLDLGVTEERAAGIVSLSAYL